MGWRLKQTHKEWIELVIQSLGPRILNGSSHICEDKAWAVRDADLLMGHLPWNHKELHALASLFATLQGHFHP